LCADAGEASTGELCMDSENEEKFFFGRREERRKKERKKERKKRRARYIVPLRGKF
jgi:hypothetical protein